MRSARNQKTKTIRLNLGCGNKPIDAFINVDAVPTRGVDLIANLQDLRFLKSDSVDEIYASHFLEHFSTKDAIFLISEFHRVLKQGGVLKLAVPDLDKICDLYMKNIDWFTPPHSPWLGLIYGGQGNDYDFHKTGFNFRWLKYLLEQADFSSVQEVVDGFEHVRDGSYAMLPFGKVSLCVQATKGPVSERISVRYDRSLLERTLVLIESVLALMIKVIVGFRLKICRKRRKRMELA